MWNKSWNPNNLLEQAIFSKERKRFLGHWHHVYRLVNSGALSIEAYTVKDARILSGKHSTSQSTMLRKAKIFLLLS